MTLRKHGQEINGKSRKKEKQLIGLLGVRGWLPGAKSISRLKFWKQYDFFSVLLWWFRVLWKAAAYSLGSGGPWRAVAWGHEERGTPTASQQCCMLLAWQEACPLLVSPTLGGLRETLLPLLSRRRVDLPWHLGGKLIWLYDYHTYYDFLKWVHSVPTIGRCCDSFNHIKRDKILRKLGMFLLTELDCIFLYIIFAYLTISSRKSREVGWLDTCNSSDCLLRTRYSFHPDRQSAGTYGQALLVRLNEYKNKNCVPDGNPAHCSEILMEKYKPSLPSTFLKRKKST